MDRLGLQVELDARAANAVLAVQQLRVAAADEQGLERLVRAGVAARLLLALYDSNGAHSDHARRLAAALRVLGGQALGGHLDVTLGDPNLAPEVEAAATVHHARRQRLRLDGDGLVTVEHLEARGAALA